MMIRLLLTSTWRSARLIALVGGMLTTACLGQTPPKPVTWPTLIQVDDRSRIPEVPRDDVICFALYTVQDNVLKLTAQLYPLRPEEPHKIVLETRKGKKWKPIAEARVHPIGWTALFRVPGWDHTRDVEYRVTHPRGSAYEGLIRRDPVEKSVIVAAAFTGNSPGPGGGTITKRDVVDSVRLLNPDVLLFTGDQVYNHTQHTAAWLEFGETFGDIIKDRPTVTIPDDHDVGQGNLWGGGGRAVEIDTQGGYTRPAGYIQLVERQQTSHLPDPYDPAPIEQTLGTYFTRMNVGGIDFAIIEDRKFKSGCYDFDVVGKGLGPRPDHIVKSDYNPADFDVPDKQLLGDRQLRFLGVWSTDWNGVVMKAVVSQTVFAMTSTYHSQDKTFYYADFDANGWPQSARNRAVEALRRCAAFHICGDQHLATLGQYGLNDWRDAGWWFCVPSVANLWPRWWQPRGQTGGNPEPNAQEFTGDFLDGFGNRMTLYAHTNPRPSNREPAELHDRMPGFGIVRFDKPTRRIIVECWPRMVDVSSPANQYPGWPRTLHQLQNLGTRHPYFLPTLDIEGDRDPVVQVIDETDGSTVCMVRIQGNQFRPGVPRRATYTVRVLGSKKQLLLERIQSVAPDSDASLYVNLERGIEP